MSQCKTTVQILLVYSVVNKQYRYYSSSHVLNSITHLKMFQKNFVIPSLLQHEQYLRKQDSDTRKNGRPCTTLICHTIQEAKRKIPYPVRTWPKVIQQIGIHCTGWTIFDYSILLCFIPIILTMSSTQFSSINSDYSYPLHVLYLFPGNPPHEDDPETGSTHVVGKNKHNLYWTFLLMAL